MNAESNPDNGQKEKKPKEYSGKRMVGIFLAVALAFSIVVLGLFYFYFFDILKDYRKRMPPPTRSVDRG